MSKTIWDDADTMRDRSLENTLLSLLAIQEHIQFALDGIVYASEIRRPSLSPEGKRELLTQIALGQWTKGVSGIDKDMLVNRRKTEVRRAAAAFLDRVGEHEDQIRRALYMLQAVDIVEGK